MEPWPLWNLVLRTPRLELRPDEDAGLAELGRLAARGVHPPEEMPFGVPWTDAPAEEIPRNVMQYFWGQRNSLTAARWTLNFLIRLDGRVIGMQGVDGTDFAITREVTSGSWLGMAHQGKGYGTEARAAVLGLVFDHLAARRARTSLFVDNQASFRVSRKLGYVEDGTWSDVRRGKAATQLRMVVTAERFAEHRPGWRPEVTGLQPCLPLLGTGHSADRDG
ncbi:GNAT family protein [Kutzneria viridogrisea]|uniref:RimJ/RimL family protein N-acetyltransferase n=1 Tax=Kutzneria viridogrisea TaxID=47990 RepID=A0ABR6BQ79_9PSEU|nr:RimJ/RimL family protein N-acetyltransferase [Kutzneria viridogrisea]